MIRTTSTPVKCVRCTRNDVSNFSGAPAITDLQLQVEETIHATWVADEDPICTITYYVSLYRGDDEDPILSEETEDTEFTFTHIQNHCVTYRVEVRAGVEEGDTTEPLVETHHQGNINVIEFVEIAQFCVWSRSVASFLSGFKVI